jgi:putative membrane protein
MARNRPPDTPPAEQTPAGERTELAGDRTVLANERTFAAWVRTGLASMVSGLGVFRFMAQEWTGPTLLATTLCLVIFGLICFVAAAWRYIQVGRRLREGGIPQTSSILVIGSVGLLVAASVAASVALVLRAVVL